MNDVMPFEFNSHKVRAFLDELGNPWFVAKDVCEVLKIKNPSQAVQSLDEDEFSMFYIGNSLRGNPNFLCVNEPGLYKLIFRSNKPKAKEFTRWVSHELLPQLRKTGTYSLPGAKHQALPEQEVTNLLYSVKFVADDLGLGTNNRLRMYHTAFRELALPTQALPEFSKEPDAKALTDLLKDHGVKVSSRTANKILEEVGIIKREFISSRKNKSGKKSYVKLTKSKGLMYGYNEKYKDSKRRTQPYYYVDKFPEIVEIIKRHMEDK